jgi:tetratricopeptide (TPR) repeat protein
MAEKKVKSRGKPQPTPSRNAASPAIGAASNSGTAAEQGIPARFALLAVAAIAVIAYVNTLGAGLVYDDTVIVKNAHMHDPWRLAAIFGSDFYGGTHAHVDLYRPLTVWTFAINWWANELFGAAGASPFVFHATNVALHAVVSALVLLCAGAFGMSRSASLAAAVLFAVHPLHTEAVANVYARSELLAALFGLAYLIFHRKGRDVLAALALFGAVCSKESALAFWPLALALDAWMPVGGKRVRFAFFTLAALGVWYSLRMAALAGGSHHADEAFVENPLVALDASERAFAALGVQLLALRLFLFPVGLSSDYSYDQIPLATSLGDPAALGATVLLVAALATAWLLRRARPWIGVGVIGYVLLWIPASNLLFPIGTIFGERLAYAPTIFGCVLVAVVLEFATVRFGKKLFLGATGAIALMAAVLTLSRNTVWNDERTLFFDQTQTAPRSAKAHFNLGTALARVGNRRGAADSFERAIAIHEPYAPAQFALANELFLIGDDLPRAERAYRAAIRADPELIDARVNLAIVLVRLARPDDAQLLADEVRRLAPRHPSLPAIDKQIQEARATKPASGGK